MPRLTLGRRNRCTGENRRSWQQLFGQTRAIQDQMCEIDTAMTLDFTGSSSGIQGQP